jgi:hypothetical protein
VFNTICVIYSRVIKQTLYGIIIKGKGLAKRERERERDAKLYTRKKKSLKTLLHTSRDSTKCCVNFTGGTTQDETNNSISSNLDILE